MNVQTLACRVAAWGASVAFSCASGQSLLDQWMESWRELESVEAVWIEPAPPASHFDDQSSKQVFVPQVGIERSFARLPSCYKILRWSVDGETVRSWEDAAALYQRRAAQLSENSASITAHTPDGELVNTKAGTRLASVAPGIRKHTDSRSGFRSPLGILADFRNWAPSRLRKLDSPTGSERYELAEPCVVVVFERDALSGAPFLSRLDRLAPSGDILLSYRFDELRKPGPSSHWITTRRQLRTRKPVSSASGTIAAQPQQVPEQHIDEEGLLIGGSSYLVLLKANPQLSDQQLKPDLSGLTIVAPGHEGDAWRALPNASELEAALTNTSSPRLWTLPLVIGAGVLTIVIGIVVWRRRAS
ncbi:MAG: hypothetical protein IT434_06235 [Phycisphaerales bacterium]|jgi:hypothetical protein|nr:hypothetical protein [Phycisphaerales bacterium]